MLAHAKDRLAGEAARAYLNGHIRRYGRIQRLRLDSRARRVELEVQLEGESAPILIDVLSYRLEKEGAEPRVTVLAVSASRPWIELALGEHVVGRSFPVPAWAAAAL